MSALEMFFDKQQNRWIPMGADSSGLVPLIAQPYTPSAAEISAKQNSMIENQNAKFETTQANLNSVIERNKGINLKRFDIADVATAAIVTYALLPEQWDEATKILASAGAGAAYAYVKSGVSPPEPAAKTPDAFDLLDQSAQNFTIQETPAPLSPDQLAAQQAAVAAQQDYDNAMQSIAAVNLRSQQDALWNAEIAKQRAILAREAMQTRVAQGWNKHSVGTSTGLRPRIAQTAPSTITGGSGIRVDPVFQNIAMKGFGDITQDEVISTAATAIQQLQAGSAESTQFLKDTAAAPSDVVANAQKMSLMGKLVTLYTIYWAYKKIF